MLNNGRKINILLTIWIKIAPSTPWQISGESSASCLRWQQPELLSLGWDLEARTGTVPRHLIWLITEHNKLDFFKHFFLSNFLNKNKGRDSLASSDGGCTINAKLLLLVAGRQTRWVRPSDQHLELWETSSGREESPTATLTVVRAGEVESRHYPIL